MFDGRWRTAVDRTTEPVGQALHRHGVTADLLTATGLLSATATAFAIALGHLHIAVVLLILTGAHDLLDGPVAKAAGTASLRGAFFDSVTDRVSDALLMGGVAWYLGSGHRPHLAVLPLGILGVTALVSYERAKAESLGLSASGGLMERAERMILLGIGFLAAWLLIPVLWVLLALTSVTAVGRFVRVWRSATEVAAEDVPDAEPAKIALTRWRQGRVESRWRNWRQGVRPRTGFGRTGEPLGRWRARRQEALTSRSARARRARRPERSTRSVARRGPGGRTSGGRTSGGRTPDRF
jgi:CDP-diacylglycerol--glycerol-3-phosphate 3-phosphatidyltransferase